jgi:hypothetical protein
VAEHEPQVAEHHSDTRTDLAACHADVGLTETDGAQQQYPPGIDRPGEIELGLARTHAAPELPCEHQHCASVEPAKVQAELGGTPPRTPGTSRQSGFPFLSYDPTS